MKTNLTKNAAKIFGGSAIAAIGFSFGRDIYKTIKRNWKNFALLIVFFASIFGIYTSGVWFARNYKSFFKSLFVRIGALIIAIPSFVILTSSSYTFLYFKYELVENKDGQAEPFYPQFSSLVSLDHETILLLIRDIRFVTLSLSVLLVGMIVGFIQRSKRKKVWDAEIHNEEFMDKHSLEEHEDNTIEDLTVGQNYKIENIGRQRITLMPIGKRGKRGYIYVGDDGKFEKFVGV